MDYKYGWAETELPKLTAQVATIGLQLDTPLGASLGATPALVLDWKRGAAVLAFSEARLSAIRDYANALTRWRDGFLLDRTPERAIWPELTLPAMPADVTAALADPNFQTDYLDRCNDLFKTLERGGMDEGQRRQFGFLVPPPAPDPSQLRAAIRSVHEFPLGVIEVNVDRGNQVQIRVTVTLDDGQVFTKTLPSAKFPFTLPTDRVHGFSVVAQYADKFGELFGFASAPFAGRSLV